MTVRLLVGDVRDRIREIPDGTVDLVCCSPPFLALRKYGDDGREMGSERTPADFLDALLELTGEFRRVLAPHGSIAIELGDTYSGSGGAGGDYGDGGLRDGQAKFKQSGWADTSKTDYATGGPHVWRKTADDPSLPRSPRGGGAGWPLAKSLTLIPTLYPASLAYGWNMLNPNHRFDRWRVRNVVVWARPNPPVGALGDKVRPATSYITVATPYAKRWFDLDAVREPSERAHGGGTTAFPDRDRVGNNRVKRVNTITANEAGAPPLDWWNPLADRIDLAIHTAAAGGYSQADLWEETTSAYGKKRRKERIADRLLREAWEAGEVEHDGLFPMTTQPYKDAHYATWPETLAARLIKMMCPLRVCTTCGKPSERITKPDEEAREYNRQRRIGRFDYTGRPPNDSRMPTGWSENGPTGGDGGAALFKTSVPTTLGWTDCGHNAWRPGVVCDPFAGSGTTLAVAQGHARDAIGIELYDTNSRLCQDRVGMFLEVDGDGAHIPDGHNSTGNPRFRAGYLRNDGRTSVDQKDYGT